MRKVLLAISIGAIGAAVGYMVRRMEEKGAFDDLKDDFNACVAKGKKAGKNFVDKSKNEMEYLQDRAQEYIGRGKQNVSQVVNEVQSKVDEQLDK